MTARTDLPDESSSNHDSYAIMLDGEVDMARAPELGTLVDGFRDSRSPHARVDLSGVTFMDSTGLSALAHLRSIAAERGGSAVLVRPPTG